jgi:hypothetical protein
VLALIQRVTVDNAGLPVKSSDKETVMMSATSPLRRSSETPYAFPKWQLRYAKETQATAQNGSLGEPRICHLTTNGLIVAGFSRHPASDLAALLRAIALAVGAAQSSPSNPIGTLPTATALIIDIYPHWTTLYFTNWNLTP